MDLVSEGSGSETAGDRSGTRVVRVLEHGTLPIGASRHHANVRRVLDGDDGAGSQQKLLPRLAKVDDVDACDK